MYVRLHISLGRGVSVIVVEEEFVEVEDHNLAQPQPHFTTTNVGQNVETQQMMQESVWTVYKRMFHRHVLTQVVAIWMAARIGAKFVSIRPTLLYYLASIKVEPQTS